MPPSASAALTSAARLAATAASGGTALRTPIVSAPSRTSRAGGRERRPGGEPLLHAPDHAIDAAIELDARPAEAIERQLGALEVAPHRVVRHLLAAVLEEQRRRDVGMRGVAAEGPLQRVVDRSAAEAAALGVRQRDEAIDAVAQADAASR